MCDPVTTRVQVELTQRNDVPFATIAGRSELTPEFYRFRGMVQVRTR
jgi:hypothetical protein